jgi:hypothetical protein
MPLLAGFLFAIVSTLMQFLVQFVTKKIAFGLAAVGTLSVITVALFTTMRAILGGLHALVSEPSAALGLAMAIPDNAPACLSAIALCWGACTLYSWQRTALQLFATVT